MHDWGSPLGHLANSCVLSVIDRRKRQSLTGSTDISQHRTKAWKTQPTAFCDKFRLRTHHEPIWALGSGSTAAAHSRPPIAEGMQRKYSSVPLRSGSMSVTSNRRTSVLTSSC